MEEEQARMRVSDADRHQVSEVLREAAGEGRNRQASGKL